MKQVLFLSALLISIFSFGQDDFYLVQPHHQKLYRNVLNSVQLGSSSVESNAKLTCPSCDTIYETRYKGVYAVKVGRGRTSKFIVANSSDSSEILAIMNLKNVYLPDPELYFGATKNGGKCSKVQRRLFAKYPPELNLTGYNESRVVSWELFIGEERFEGEGRDLTKEAGDYLEQTDASVISFLTVVMGPDGISRRMGAVFSL